MTDETYGRDKHTIEQMFSNKEDAEKAHHMFYYSGVPCIHGHLSPKRTSNNRCRKCEMIPREAGYFPKLRRIKTKEEKTESRRQYWKDNKDKLSVKNKEYYDANRDKASKRDKLYYENNRQKIRDRKKRYYLENQEKLKKYQRDYRKSVKKEKAMIDDGDFL